MKKTEGKLFGNFVAAGLKDLKDFAKKAATEGTAAAKKVVDKALYSFDLSSDEIKEQLAEMKSDLSGIMTDAKMDSIMVTLRNVSRETQIKMVGRLSGDNQRQIAALSVEMKAIINDCQAQISEREKMLFPKIRTVAELAEVCKELELDVDFHMFSPKALVIGEVSGKSVTFYLEAGDYSQGVKVYSIPYEMLCSE